MDGDPAVAVHRDRQVMHRSGDDQAVVAQRHVDAACAVVNHGNVHDLRKPVEIGVPLVPEAARIAFEQAGRFQSRDSGIERGDLVDQCIGFIDQAVDLRVGTRPERIETGSEIGDALRELHSLLDSELPVGRNLGLVDQVVERPREAVKLVRDVTAAQSLQRCFELLVDRVAGA